MRTRRRLEVEVQRGKQIVRVLVALVCLLATAPAIAETVFVRYRGYVDLAPFDCRWIQGSSVVRRICYDIPNRYLLVNLNDTYYHYCRIDSETVSQWLGASSKGRFYNANIRGRFDCRRGGVPE